MTTFVDYWTHRAPEGSSPYQIAIVFVLDNAKIYLWSGKAIDKPSALDRALLALKLLEPNVKVWDKAHYPVTHELTQVTKAVINSGNDYWKELT